MACGQSVKFGWDVLPMRRVKGDAVYFPEKFINIVVFGIVFDF